jgi:hypothetical protein
LKFLVSLFSSCTSNELSTISTPFITYRDCEPDDSTAIVFGVALVRLRGSNPRRGSAMLRWLSDEVKLFDESRRRRFPSLEQYLRLELFVANSQVLVNLRRKLMEFNESGYICVRQGL